MNTREIATAVNKDERSVRRWINKASDKMSGLSDKMSGAEKTKIPADYTLEETCFIIENGLGKNAAEIFRTNAVNQSQYIATLESTSESTLTEKDIEMITTIVSLTIKSLMPHLNKPVLKEPEKQLTFNDVPEKSKRAELREIINKYTAHRGCNHIEVWSQLYQQIYYRMNINVKLCADNRGMDKLDYIEKEGLLNEVLSLAKKLFEV